MKTMNLFKAGLLLIAALAVLASGCKKDETTNNGNKDTASLQQLTKDENEVSTISDEAGNDANAALSGGNNGLKYNGPWLCNVTIDSLLLANDTIVLYLTYNGLNCNGTLDRHGKQEVRRKASTFWGQAGTVVISKLIDFQVTRVATGKSMTLNGTRQMENVSGGVMWQLGNGLTSIVHRMSGSMQATFDDGTTRTWNIARQIVFTGNIGGTLVRTTDGFGSAEGYDNLSTWGTTRNGEQFYTQITQSVVHKQACQWKPCSGMVYHQVPSDNKTALVTFGYDDNNQPITGDDCPTRYRIDWAKNGYSGTIFMPLW